MADPQMAQYVVAQRQAGHSDAEIKQALISNGYTPLQAEEVFRSLRSNIAVDPQLNSLVMQYLQSGMSTTQVIAALTSQGYPGQAVHAAIKSCVGIDERPHHGIMIAFMFIAAMVGGGLLVLLIQHTGSNSEGAAVITNPGAIMADIFSKASTNKDAAVRSCRERLAEISSDNVDVCIMKVAILDTVQDDTICDQIYTPDQHDACLLNFLNMPDRFDAVCSRMKLNSNVQTCNNIKSLRSIKA